MQAQPTSTTCGPTALHAVYRYWGDDIALDAVIDEARALEGGGTLAVLLGTHALRRGYQVQLYSYNLTLLDPTWFEDGSADLASKLAEQAERKPRPRLRLAGEAYARFLELGGELQMADFTLELVSEHLAAGRPILAGVSATYLYGCARELPDGSADDIRGEPQGHFVVVVGEGDGNVAVADPWPMQGKALQYEIPVSRFITAALLGVLTFDGNILVVRPQSK